MKISVSLPPVWKAQGLCESELLDGLKECGYSYFCEEIEIAGQGPGNSGRRLSEISAAGLIPVKARILCTAPFDMKTALLEAIDYCAELGVKQIVVPLCARDDNTRWEYFDMNSEYLAPLLVQAGMRGVKLLIENQGPYQTAHQIRCGTELNSFYEYMGCPQALGFNLNIGQQGLMDAALYPDTRVYGERLCSVDASDNFFAMQLGTDRSRADLGLAPLSGFLDFDESFLALREIGYDGVYNLRMNSPRVFEKHSPYIKEPKLRLMPFELVKRHYAWARRVTEYMLEAYGYNSEAGEDA